MPSSRDTIITRLQMHAAEWITDIAEFKGLILASHYFSLPNNRGGVMRPAESFTLQDGQEITFSDVPVAKVVKSTENAIKTRVPESRRTEIYHQVLRGMPGHKSVPDWDHPDNNRESIYAEPLTPFSMPRDEAISNQDLLDALAPAIGITLSSAAGVGTTIAWWDAMSGGKLCASMSFSGGVSGGRLGRDHQHTISDVPRNYFRDRLMDYILQHEVDEEVKEAARKAICPDLTDAEIEKYAVLISQDRKRKDEENEAERQAPQTQATREEVAREYVAAGEVSTMAQAMKVISMDEALGEIDSDIDWQTPKPMGIRRRAGVEVEGSVTTPHWAPLGIERVEPDMEVDRDCDQVRAMIKIFIMSPWSSWSAEEFRIALADNITRDKFTAFLKRRGTDATQKRSAAYLLSWEFFNRRQKLGLPLEGADPRDDLDILVEKRDDAKRSERERAMIATHKEEREALEKRQSLEIRGLSRVHKGQLEAQIKAHVEELKALVAAHPWGTPGHSEKLRELAEKQEKEDDIEREKQAEQDSILGDTHCKEIQALEREQEQQLGALKKEERQEAVRAKEEREALGETRPSRLNKRSSGGAGRGRAKRARS
ncbi:hypothetical protein V8F20_004400 [Naviculisporaceae sp. PSN 640]